MSGLPALDIESERPATLRSRAATRLIGEAAAKGAAARAVDALAVLHTLASSAETAPAALTLLHELQVHQVEIEMQAQEMRESRAELEMALERQIELYDHQPVGCFTVDPRLVLLELNHAGADMLGIARDAALGMRLDAFMGADSARRLRLAIESLDAGTRPSSCILRLCPKEGPERAVMAGLGADPGAKGYLLSLMNAGEGPRAPHEGF
jgi:PAS domain-containing protein